MTAEAWLQPLINGLLIGANYILVALGLTVIFSVMNVLNFAHGEIYMIGGFCVYFLCSVLHLNYIVSLILAMIVTGILGLILERILFRPLKGDLLSSVIVAISLIWLFQTSAQLIFGKLPKGMAEVISGIVNVLGFNVSKARIVAALLSIVLLSITYFFVYKTKQGKAMQAFAQDKEAAALQGISISRIGPLGFFIGCALAGAAGGIVVPILGIDATAGGTVLNASLSIIILGGLGSIPGAALGGIILGLIVSYGQTYLGYIASIFPFLIIIIVLLFKRTGLMGGRS
jgi:branched-chain amino acid transport system permease protein